MDFSWLETFCVALLTSGSFTLIFRTYISEKLKGRIQAQYAGKLEEFKAQLKETSDLRLELHKADLKGKSDLQLERLKSELSTSANERHTLLTALVTRRFDAIADVHAKLLRFHEALTRLVGPLRLGGVDEDALVKDVVETSTAFSQALTEQRIFFTDATAKQLIELRRELFTQSRLFQFTVMMARDETRKTDNWVKISEAVDGPLTDAVANLERELRGLMGDKESDINPTGSPTTP